MRRGVLLAAGLGLIVLVVALWNVPMHFLRQKTEEWSHGRLRILNSSGSWWSGRAQLGLSDGNTVFALPDPVAWSFFLGGKAMAVGFEIRHPTLVQALEIGWRDGKMAVAPGAMRFPANWLGALGAPFNTIRPEGVLQCNWAAYSQNESIQLVVKWVDAQSALASIRPLGEYVVEVTGNPNVALLSRLRTTQGPLMLEGEGNWAPGQRFAFQGHAHAEGPHKAALTGLLSQMGQLEGGRYRLGVF